MDEGGRREGCKQLGRRSTVGKRSPGRNGGGDGGLKCRMLNVDDE